MVKRSALRRSKGARFPLAIASASDAAKQIVETAVQIAFFRTLVNLHLIMAAKAAGVALKIISILAGKLGNVLFPNRGVDWLPTGAVESERVPAALFETVY